MYINRKGVQFSWIDSIGSDSLSPIIISWLRNFKKHYSKSEWAGVPVSVLCELFPDTIDHNEEQMQAGRDKFIAEIDEMIWAFEVDDMPEDCYLVEPTEDDPFGGELNMPLIYEHRDRKQAGLDLFANRYQNLWW